MDKSVHKNARTTNVAGVNQFRIYHHDLRKQQNLRYRQRIQEKSSVVVRKVLPTDSSLVDIVYSNAAANNDTLQNDNLRLLVENVHHQEDYSADEDEVNHESETDSQEIHTSSDDEDRDGQQFLFKIIDFIRQSNLNKVCSASLLALLRSANQFDIKNIPATTDSLWKALNISFDYQTMYFCSNCFQQPKAFKDICTSCRIYKNKRNAGDYQINLLLSTDRKPIVKSKQTQTSVWPITSFIVEIPHPVREYLNNSILLGVWNSLVTPPASILFDQIDKNLKLLIANGINISINNKMQHFSVGVQLISGDLPARSKFSRLVSHNGFFACSRCLIQGVRCQRPRARHTLYRWSDFIQLQPPERTQEHINECVQQINLSNKILFGVLGRSPLSSLLSIPKQSTFDYFHLILEIHLREMFNQGAGITPGHTRQFTTTTSNSLMTSDDDLDESNLENNEFDENNPWIRDVPLFSQPHRQSSVRRTNQNKNKGSYDTPQVKRRRIQDQVESISQDTLNESFNLIQSMLQDMNRKIDLLAQRVDDFGKKLDIVDKRLGGLARRVNKNPTPGEIPNNLPVIVRQLFTEKEIIDREHEQDNERTTKIKDAIKACFFKDDKDKLDAFWECEGKITRGNQRRGRAYRQKVSLLSQTQITASADNAESTVNNITS
ncbi:unnamed protein product [Rotaria magnacalcarata]|uniref:Uncharacterized protein n=5 Tax=Rotaria magnacalcarata TaxID=392030 RepID=A0A815T0W4_9BILA|nr:unnamed protein product [Rotaria magnacalcarata]